MPVILAFCYGSTPLCSPDLCVKLHNQQSILKSHGLAHERVEFLLMSELVTDCIGLS